MGHGSFSGCVFLVDPETQFIITQVFKQSGPRNRKWLQRFFQTIASVLRK